MTKFTAKMKAARQNLFRAMEALPQRELLNLLCDELEACIGEIQYLGMDIRQIVDDFDWERHEEEAEEDRRLSLLEKKAKRKSVKKTKKKGRYCGI